MYSEHPQATPVQAELNLPTNNSNDTQKSASAPRQRRGPPRQQAEGQDKPETGSSPDQPKPNTENPKQGDRKGHHKPRHQHSNKQGNKPRNQQQKKKQPQKKPQGGRGNKLEQEIRSEVNLGNLPGAPFFKDAEALSELLAQATGKDSDPLNFNEIQALSLHDLTQQARENNIIADNTAPNRKDILRKWMHWAFEKKTPIIIQGYLENLGKDGVLVYDHDNYKAKSYGAYIHESMINTFGLQRGQFVEVQVHPAREGESCPFALKVNKIMDADPKANEDRQQFEDLVPYYPTERILLETNEDVPWDNTSMRIVDLLTPIGLGQRGLIVAPPRTGKTVLLQGIAHAVTENRPDAHLIVLLIDERPEEVTDFKRQVTKGEVISSTFDQPAASHVHVAEMVIEKARRMVESGRDVVIILDSITRLARAYNAIMPSSGRVLSGGVEANALQKPKRFFGSARNIEDGGSLTILGSALVDTGSKMDEVIFEEFKGTSNMELHLDRGLVDKRMYPAIKIEASGTRKEELLYHPDELEKIYALRRAMKGVPGLEAMEMLIQRVKKTKTNVDFLMGLNR